MKFTGERYIPGQTRKIIEEDHIKRYEFASVFAKNKKVLDIACGTGYGSKILYDGGANQVLGVDISAESINYAKNNYTNTNIEFFCEPANNLSFPDNFFDLVVSFETIEHLADNILDDYLHELKRVMKPGAKLIISTPNKKVTSPYTATPLNKFHVREYYLNDFKNIILKFNFNINNIYGQRQIKSWLNAFWVRKMIYFIGLFNNLHLKIYDVANGPEVKPLETTTEPTYFIMEAQK